METAILELNYPGSSPRLPAKSNQREGFEGYNRSPCLDGQLARRAPGANLERHYSSKYKPQHLLPELGD